MNNPVPARLAALRAAMKEHGVAAVLVPSADPHLSEYLPAHWSAREWLSGFAGSAGTLVVGRDQAGLWTDSRYFAQAEQQLAGSGIGLMKLRVPHTPEHLEWLQQHLGEGEVLAVAGDSVAVGACKDMQRRLAEVGASVRTDLDLPGAVWPDRPALPLAPIFAHDPAYAATPRVDKLKRVRQAMRKLGASHHLLSSLDDIAWLTNLRGSDVECNPVFLAHLLLQPDDRATLFVQRSKLDDALVAALAADGIGIADYASTTSTSAELDHIREVMRRDGTALVRGFRRLEQRLAAGMTVTELDVDRLLHEERSTQPGWICESFATIAGYQANGALPHYRATPESHSTLHPKGLLLIDSGGQYLGGTTDITRVLALGETTPEQRRDATLVLKG